jgi:hypothetical protein
MKNVSLAAGFLAAIAAMCAAPWAAQGQDKPAPAAPAGTKAPETGPAPSAAGESKAFSFDANALPPEWKVTGDVALDGNRNHAEGAGASMRVGPAAKVVWKFRQQDGPGKVEMWIYDDGTRTEEKVNRAGPRWGIVQSDGKAFLLGPLYASNLAGRSYYSSESDGTKWASALQWLGVGRTPGWRKFTISCDANGSFSVLIDGKDLAAEKKFVPSKVTVKGIAGVAIWGDQGKGNEQTVWVDDVTAAWGGAASAPPPSPSPAPAAAPALPESPSKAAAAAGTGAPAPAGASPYAKWKNGPSTDPRFFPIGVWGQNVRDAARYKEAGVNLYLGGSFTKEKLAALKALGISAVASASEENLALKDDPTIVAWLLMDEPDLSKSVSKVWKDDANRMKEAWPDEPTIGRPIGEWQGNGPPWPPKWIQADGQKAKAADPTRPVILNLGIVGPWQLPMRRFRKTHHEDYAEYFKSSDIASQDYYPGRGQWAQADGKFYYVAKCVQSLRQYAGPDKIVWNIVEAMKPINTLTPHACQAEVWMSIIHGAQGIGYFVHQMGPPKGGDKFIEASVFEDANMLKAFTETNHLIASLATVLNGPSVKDAVAVSSSEPAGKELAGLDLLPIAAMVKRQAGTTYLFAVRMEETPSTGTFTLPGLPAKAKAEVLTDGRSIDVQNGKFSDDFQGYDVRIYKIVTRPVAH